MTDILLTNDDGYNSIGFFPLLKALSGEFSVVSVVPSEQRSWIGKSITADREIELKKVNVEGNPVYSCSGTPADCVQIGLYGVLDKKPKMVVSGINIGENVGHSRILSSGTVGAAMEASIDGIKAVASSLYIPPHIEAKTNFSNPDNYSMFQNAAQITLKLVKIFAEVGFYKGTDLISINIPFDANVDSGFEVTKPSRSSYGKLFHSKGNRFVLINPDSEFRNLKDGTDLKALSEGKISITPLSLELASGNSPTELETLIRKHW